MYLPRGNTLDDEVFRRRHLLLCWFLGLHLPALFAFAVWRGFGVRHAVLEIAVPAVCLLFARLSRHRRLTAFFVTAGLVFCSSVLVHLSRGNIEAHFHFFVLIGLIALYQDWVPFLWNVVFTVLSHGVGGALSPHGIYNHHAAQQNPWLWAVVHGVAVLAASVGVIVFWKNTEMEQQRNASLAADLAKAQLEAAQRVHEMLDQRRRAAVEANLAKDEFLSHISHELRTPLTAVIGFGQMLEEQDLSPDDHQCAHHIVHAGQHLLGLINDLLDISKIEIGQLTISVEPISVHEVIDDTVALVRSLAAGRSITITTGYQGDAMVEADHQRIRQILLNLLSNAIKYNRHAGHVDLTVTFGEELTRISVTDTGAGVSPEGLARLFQPFERLDAASTDVEGSGIGLALTKRLVEAIGGTIGVESTVGQGTTFWVDLSTSPGISLDPRPTPATPQEPRADSPLDEAQADASPPPADTPPHQRPVVLYVDDSQVNIAFLQHLFRDRPERLEVTTEGRHALDLARELHPRLVLLDLNLPDTNGDEVLRMLKADPATADIPIVILSAEATPGRSDQMLAHGASAYLTKPLDADRLVEILDRNEDVPSSVELGWRS
jgi:signal transduction histidine kinase/ActR/RegA family two-component response regulator